MLHICLYCRPFKCPTWCNLERVNFHTVALEFLQVKVMHGQLLGEISSEKSISVTLGARECRYSSSEGGITGSCFPKEGRVRGNIQRSTSGSERPPVFCYRTLRKPAKQIRVPTQTPRRSALWRRRRHHHLSKWHRRPHLQKSSLKKRLRKLWKPPNNSSHPNPLSLPSLPNHPNLPKHPKLREKEKRKERRQKRAHHQPSRTSTCWRRTQRRLWQRSRRQRRERWVGF